MPNPTFRSPYASNGEESKFPDLWKGLVGAWCPSLGQTGLTLKDMSVENNDGTLTNMNVSSDWVIQNKGRYGSGLALDFDGTGDYVNLGQPSHLAFAHDDAFTISIKAKHRSAQDGYLFSKSESAGDFKGIIFNWLDDGTFLFRLRDTGSAAIQRNTTATFGLNQWFDFTVTYDGSANVTGLKIYVDGIEAATNTTGTTGTITDISNSINANISGRNNGNSRVFDGQMDDILVYDRKSSWGLI